MAKKSNFTGRVIPNLTAKKSQPVTTNFARGIYTYKPNDTMDSSEVRLAQDARFDRVGEYGTRLGYKKLSEPMGKAKIADSSTGDMSLVTGDRIQPYSFTAAADNLIYSVKVWLKRADATKYVVPKLVLSVDGEEVASACVNPATLDSGMAREVIFNNCPNIFNGETVTITLGVQTGELSNINVRGNASGVPGPILCEVYTAASGSVGNIFEANIDGDKSILFTFGGTLYWQNSAGTVASIRALPDGVTKVRFNQNLNTIRYADGKEGPRLLTPTVSDGVVTAWVDSAIPTIDLETEVDLGIKVSNIMNAPADDLMYFDAETDTQVAWTYAYGYSYAKSPAFSTTATIQGNPGDTLTISSSTITPSGIAVGDWITGQGTSTAEVTAISGSTVSLRIVDTTPQTISSYDKFDRRFRQNLPAILTGDPLTAMFNLGGVLYFMTRRNKYQMYMQAADAWTQSNTNAQNGTFSQESVVCDLNYAYFANDNGIYIFDGASESSLTENSIQNVYDAIPDKESIILDLYKNRLYVYYPSIEGGVNDHCLVYNINLKVWESFDSNTWVSATSARQNASNRFICGHSRVGMLMLNESVSDNDYSDMGQAIAFNLETSYQHFGTTSQQKRISKWRPQFATTTKPYTVECGYSLDYTDQVKYAFSIDLLRQVPTITNHVWDNPSDYGVPAIPTRHTTTTKVNGEFYRCQIRYQHIAAFEPVIFRSHTLTVETQRIR